MATQDSLGGANPQDVDNFRSFVGVFVPTEEIVDRLKRNYNDIEKAINEYYLDQENGRPYKPSPQGLDPAWGNATNSAWDDSAFTDDRDGSPGNHSGNLPAFAIEAPAEPDDSRSSFAVNGSPSRPPSRANHRSPLSRVTDVTDSNPIESVPMTNYDPADSDLERALALSLAEAGMEPMNSESSLGYQESGITTGTSNPHFGPANRPTYQEHEWGMTAVSTTCTSDIVLDPEAKERQRDLDSPAFLKPSSGEYMLGAFLTNCHEIPLLREILLDRDDCADGNSYDKDWWAGKPIETTGTSESGGDAIVGEDKRLNREVQRLMAFLDMTERSYGSVEVLTRLPIFRKKLKIPGRSDKALRCFLNQWKQNYDHSSDRYKALISTVVGNFAITSNHNEVSDALFDLNLPSQASPKESLYDLMDDTLWPGNDLEAAGHFVHLGQVIAFQLIGDQSARNIKIPTIWYPDRYLQSSVSAVLQMRVAKKLIEAKIESWDKVAARLLSCTDSETGNKISVKAMLSRALLHDHYGSPEVVAGQDVIEPEDSERKDTKVKDTEVRDRELIDAEREDKDVQDAAGTDCDNSSNALSAGLRRLMANIDSKLLELQEAKEKAQMELKALAKLYTEPSEDPSLSPVHKYYLRGVIVSKYLTYVCRRPEPELIDMGLDDKSSLSPDQWWKIHWPASVLRAAVEKCTEDEVLRTVEEDSKNLILVYASQVAMDSAVKRTPSALEHFVKQDNLEFQRELIDQASPCSGSSGKRKWDEDSNGSTASDRSHYSLSRQGPRVTSKEVTFALSDDVGSDSKKIDSPSQSQQVNGLSTGEESRRRGGGSGTKPQEMQEVKNIWELARPLHLRGGNGGIVDMDEVIRTDDTQESATTMASTEDTSSWGGI